MAQKRPRENSEYESEYDSEYNSENDSEYDSENDSEYGSVNEVKKVKIREDPETENLQTDKNGHIICHPGQKIGIYEIGSILGEGAFGRVLQATNVTTGQRAALKIVKNDQTKRRSAMAEIIALTVISCRDGNNKSYCINMLNWFNYGGHVCIAFPLLGQSVFDFLKENNFEPFSIDHVRHISYQLCHAVEFLHRNGMTHTDLKPENILFVNSSYTTVCNNENKMEIRRPNCTDIRLTDFGCVTRDTDYHFPIIATRYYRAPEVMLELGWTHSCDVWAIGCTLIDIYFGNLLFPTEDDREHLAMMEKTLGQIPLRMANATKKRFFKNGLLDWNWNESDTDDAKEYCRPLKKFQLSECEDDCELFRMIEKMLQYEPTNRLSMSEAIVHPFFNKLPSHQRA